METLTLNLSTEERNNLDKRAVELGLPAEELLRRSLKQVLSPTKMSFREAVEYTFQKNAELYRRLA